MSIYLFGSQLFSSKNIKTVQIFININSVLVSNILVLGLESILQRDLNMSYVWTKKHITIKITWLYQIKKNVYNTSEHRRQLWSSNLATRLSGSGIKEEVTLFQKWNVKDSLIIFLNSSSCFDFSSSVAGYAKQLIHQSQHKFKVKKLCSIQSWYQNQ